MYKVVLIYKGLNRRYICLIQRNFYSECTAQIPSTGDDLVSSSIKLRMKCTLAVRESTICFL